MCERLGIPLLSFRHVPSVNHPTTAVVTLRHRKVGDPCCNWKQSSFICTNANSNSFVGVFVQPGKASMIFVMSICPPASTSAAPNIRIYLKFDIRHFNENLWRTNFIMIGQKYQELILILSMYHYCRRY